MKSSKSLAKPKQHTVGCDTVIEEDELDDE